MRYLATLAEEPLARKFGDYLLTLGIHHELEAGQKGWDLWIADEDDLERAQRELGEFERNPGEARYEAAAHSAKAVRAEHEKAALRRRKNFVDVRTSWAIGAMEKSFPVTITLILLSVLATLLVYGGDQRGVPVFSHLSIAKADLGPQATRAERLRYRASHITAGRVLREEGVWTLLQIRWLGLWEVQHGQIWRLITPIFVHFGLLHILFDMWWLYDLGRAVESRKGHWKLLGIVLLCGVVGNLGQYLWSGADFGGMSGVVYGLLGYLWIKGRLQPHEQLGVQPVIVWFMLGWLVLCMTGMIGPIANGAHLMGLITGVLIAAAAYGLKRARRL